MADISKYRTAGRISRSVRHIDCQGEYATVRMIIPGIDHVVEPKPISQKTIMASLIACLAGWMAMTGLVAAFMMWGLHALGLLVILFAGFWIIAGAIDAACLMCRRLSAKAGRRGNGRR